MLAFMFLNTTMIEAAGKTIEIGVDTANIRSEPSPTATIIAKANRHDQFEVQQEKFGWYEIQLASGKNGWIASYIVFEDYCGTKETKKQGAVKVDHLHVRQEPSLTSEIIGKLHTGDQVNIINEKDGWANIMYNGQSAWVSRQYISGTSSSDQASPEGFVYISNEGTHLRSGPDLSAPVIARGSTGERYPIIGQEGDWYHITLASGKEAYVASWVVSTSHSTSSESPPPRKATNRTPGLDDKTIVLDAGHGGFDPGSIKGIGIFEKQLTLDTTKRLAEKLKAAGVNVILTRADDRHIPLSERTSIANTGNKDAFISIHYDSSYNILANGFTTYYYHDFQSELATAINQAMGDSLPIYNRGARQGDYYVIRENALPAVILELGYLSNPEERAYIMTPEYQEAVVDSIYEGLQDYFK